LGDAKERKERILQTPILFCFIAQVVLNFIGPDELLLGDCLMVVLLWQSRRKSS